MTMEPKFCEICGLRPALPGADECSICLLGYDSAEAKKPVWKPLLQSEHIENDEGPLDVCPFCGGPMKPGNLYGKCNGCYREHQSYREDW